MDGRHYLWKQTDLKFHVCGVNLCVWGGGIRKMSLTFMSVHSVLLEAKMQIYTMCIIMCTPASLAIICINLQLQLAFNKIWILLNKALKYGLTVFKYHK